MWLLKSPLVQNSIVVLRATSILGGQKNDKEMMCSITLESILQIGPGALSGFGGPLNLIRFLIKKNY
jgi:hypothetical protein